MGSDNGTNTTYNAYVQEVFVCKNYMLYVRICMIQVLAHQKERHWWTRGAYFGEDVREYVRTFNYPIYHIDKHCNPHQPCNYLIGEITCLINLYHPADNLVT